MSQLTKYDVTVNITAHKETYYLFRTLKSILAMLELAKAEKITTIVQIHLDNADPVTEKIANDFAKENKDCVIYANHFGDASASRNFLIDKTSSKYILFVDGDDLFTENFICEAFKVAEQFGHPCIVSAEDIIKFGDAVDPYIFRVESTVDKPGIKSALFEMNLYISQNLVTTEIFKACKYEPNMGNYGFEDWHWNTKAIYEGYEFLVAKDTVFFYRQKPHSRSLLKRNVNDNTVVRPTPLFNPDFFAKLHHDRYIPSNVLNNTAIVASRRLSKIIPRSSLPYRVARKFYHLAKNTIVAKSTSALPSSDELELGYAPGAVKENLWAKMNQIDPAVRLDAALKSRLELGLYAHQHALATTYRMFCETYGEDGFTDVIFVPWINRGGADLAMLDLARELARTKGRVLIITTNGIDSQWADKARAIPGVVFLQSHDSIFKHLDHINIKLFFLRLIQNWNISSMTIMNSAIGFELVERFGYAIRDTGCRIVVHNYAFPVSDGQIVDAFPALSTSLDHIDAIVTDSDFHRNEIYDIYGFELDKIVEIPLMIDSGLEEKTSKPTNRILFANRIAREKQPQVAIEVAKILQDRGIFLDIYGARDDHFCKEIHFDQLVSDTPNVEYKGLFSTSKELKFNDYDICFMPSLYEGTPRILLESVKSGLYVVCSDVGGMPETIASEVSGVVLGSDSQPIDYANAISAYYDNANVQKLEVRRKANRVVIEKHSDVTYARLVASIYRSDRSNAHD